MLLKMCYFLGCDKGIVDMGQNVLTMKCTLKYLGIKSHSVYNLLSNDSAKKKKNTDTYTDKANMAKCLLFESRWKAHVFIVLFQLHTF